jgi:hypothetical protein
MHLKKNVINVFCYLKGFSINIFENEISMKKYGHLYVICNTTFFGIIRFFLKIKSFYKSLF